MSNLVASFPSHQEFQTMKELGHMAVHSGLLPAAIKTSEQAIIIMLKGRELGIPPMQAFSSIAVVNGKPTMSAELMLSMIYRNVPGAIVDFLNTDANVCLIEAKRPGGKPTQFSFSMEDAKRANLSGKGPWMTYPAAMLRARCISAMARAMFPDALSGVVYTPEEIGASVDEDGQIIDIPPQELPKEPPTNIPEPVQISKITGTIQPGDHIFDFGSVEKGYLGMTIRQAVDRDGLPKVQNYLFTLIDGKVKAKENVPPKWLIARDRLNEYAALLKLVAQRVDRVEEAAKLPPTFDQTMSEEDEAHVERMIDEERMGRNSQYTPEDAARDRGYRR